MTFSIASKFAKAALKDTQKRICGLSATLLTLPSCPDIRTYNGAAFIKLPDAFAPPGECDSLLGTVLTDGFLSGVFSQAGGLDACNDNAFDGAVRGGDMMNALDLADEYFKDAHENSRHDHNNKGRGRGSIALYERNMLCKHFKPASRVKAPSDSFAQRQAIEGEISGLLRKFYALDRLCASL
ncbi:MAG: hypothetical protein KDI46_09995 [Alphaproteobacteria bacterium]|nr:hypothetical protein [Alphaproteobacteria bacterium]